MPVARRQSPWGPLIQKGPTLGTALADDGCGLCSLFSTKLGTAPSPVPVFVVAAPDKIRKAGGEAWGIAAAWDWFLGCLSGDPRSNQFHSNTTVIYNLRSASLFSQQSPSEHSHFTGREESDPGSQQSQVLPSVRPTRRLSYTQGALSDTLQRVSDRVKGRGGMCNLGLAVEERCLLGSGHLFKFRSPIGGQNWDWNSGSEAKCDTHTHPHTHTLFFSPVASLGPVALSRAGRV